MLPLFKSHGERRKFIKDVIAAVWFVHIWHKYEQGLPNVGSKLKVLGSRDI